MASALRHALEELSVRMPQCAFKAYCFKFLNKHLRQYRSRCLIVRLRQTSWVIHFQAATGESENTYRSGGT